MINFDESLFLILKVFLEIKLLHTDVKDISASFYVKTLQKLLKWRPTGLGNLRPGRLTPNILTGLLTLTLTLGFLRDFHELPYHKSTAGGVKSRI